jgi:hypothetical protein
MSKLKEAAALALNALEECQYATTSKADKMVDVAMKALRAALEEPEPEPVEETHCPHGRIIADWCPECFAETEAYFNARVTP